jgi:hypothetical protein
MIKTLKVIYTEVGSFTSKIGEIAFTLQELSSMECLTQINIEKRKALKCDPSHSNDPAWNDNSLPILMQVSYGSLTLLVCTGEHTEQSITFKAGESFILVDKKPNPNTKIPHGFYSGHKTHASQDGYCLQVKLIVSEIDLNKIETPIEAVQ